MAWDDYTQNTVFAQVSTARTSNAGKIFLYPGFYDAPGGDEDLLHYRQELISSKPSESYVLWDYSNRTDHPVGVACAPNQDDLDYNCLVAWNDRGVPDGSVLYQYFLVDTSGDDINFRPTASTKLTGAYAVGGVSAAWFDGKFWIAFKSGIDPFHDVYTAYTTSSTSYTSWSTPISLGRFNIVDPPTWYYVPHQTHETALSWTEAHTQP